LQSQFQDSIVSLIKKIRPLLSQFSFEKGKKPTMIFEEEDKQISLLRQYERFIVDQCKLSEILYMKRESISKQTLKSCNQETNFYLDIKKVCNVELEKEKIQKNLQKAQKLLENLQKKIDKKDYTKVVPKDVQEIERN
jgi:valyl-tRNA synthetase